MNRSLLVVLGSLFLVVAAVSADDKEKPKTNPEKVEPDKAEPDKTPSGPLPLDKLVAKNKELVPTLIAGLKDPDAQVRQTTAYILANLGKDAVPGLIDAMASKDADMRANASYVLGALGKLAQDAMPVLVKSLKDESPDVRQRAAYAIQRILSETPPPQPPPPPLPPMPPAKEGPDKTEPKKGDSRDKEKSGAAMTPGVIQASWPVPAMNLPPDPGLLLPPAMPGSRPPAMFPPPVAY